MAIARAASAAGFTIVDENVAGGHVGSGSFGQVFLGIHETTGTRAAIKKVKAALPSDDAAKELRFFSKLLVAARIFQKESIAAFWPVAPPLVQSHVGVIVGL